MTTRDEIAYFSMEIALEDAIPTFSGGLGVLAGDYLKSAADLELPLVAVTLLYKHGFFSQQLEPDGQQRELEVDWEPHDLLEELAVRAELQLDGRTVTIGAFRYEIAAEEHGAGRVPVYLIHTDLEENDEEARQITDQLYSGDDAHRLRQEAVLGLGGMEILRALGHEPRRFHLNEGHSALLLVELLGSREPDEVRSCSVFTTHTPVPAGHDRFARQLLAPILGVEVTSRLEALGCLETDELNMSELGIAGSQHVNAVSLLHREVTAEMFPGVDVFSVTNGVHVARWAAPSVASLFDRHVPGWRRDNARLRYIGAVSLDEIERAHLEEKRRLIDQVVDRAGRYLDSSALTIGVARRATAYKRTTLVLSDVERLTAMAESLGPLQLVFSGKAHPADEGGKALIKEIVRVSAKASGALQVVFLEDYEMRIASLLVAGCDVWLNTPLKPNEASGTSGMKAALNGVPSLSVPDGWWAEGLIEGVTGWGIEAADPSEDGAALYEALEKRVLPAYYGEGIAELRRSAISLNGSFFNTERMVREYASTAYCAEATIGG